MAVGVRRLWPIAMLSSALVLMPTATAASAETTVSFKSKDGFSIAKVRAEGSRENDIKVRTRYDQREEFLFVEDEGARIKLEGDGCSAIGSHGALCPINPRRPFVSVLIRAGAGDDVVSAHLKSRFAPFIFGGPGGDVIRTARTSDAIFPGPGRDDVATGKRADAMIGGPAADGDDIWKGGAGTDIVYYDGRSNPVTVDLTLGVGGEPGEADELVDVESVAGGAGADVLTGSTGRNLLIGGDRADVLRGGAGKDDLDGGRGTDEFFGEAGADALFSFDRKPETVDCGPGSDIAFIDAGDTPVDCEDTKSVPRRSRPLERRREPLDSYRFLKRIGRL